MSRTVKERRREERRQWREQEERDIEASKQRMARETGVPRSHPKFERLWDMAWQEGHSNGISEVEQYFREFAQLVVPDQPPAPVAPDASNASLGRIVQVIRAELPPSLPDERKLEVLTPLVSWLQGQELALLLAQEGEVEESGR